MNALKMPVFVVWSTRIEIFEDAWWNWRSIAPSNAKFVFLRNPESFNAGADGEE